MSIQYLLMWLEAPLQSWGVDSKFVRRDTMQFPTKSGILGLICCALGASGEQHDLLKMLGDSPMTVFAFSRTKEKKDGSLIKMPRQALLCDFQMVGSGYSEENSWQSLMIPKTSSGSKAVGGGTKLTYRYYLQDAYFCVILELQQELAFQISEALQNPVFDIYLGRKDCVPTDFIFRGCYLSFNEALNAMAEISKEKKLIEDFRVIEAENPEEGDVLTLNDIPIQFGKVKKYRDRRVTIIQPHNTHG
jgi:CRISPR system Cascade subunit CasD